jgi:F-type H+-transporting ATPase subunit delta
VASLKSAFQAILRALGTSPASRLRQESAEELLAMVRLLDHEPRLRSAFSDPSLTPEAKQDLARAVFGEAVGEQALETFVTVVTSARLRSSEVPDAVEAVAAQALMDVADDAGVLAEAEDHLARFAALAEHDTSLRAALTDPALAASEKRAIVDDLMAGRADPRAVILIQHWVERDQVRRLAHLAEETIAEAEARRDRVVADVVSAVPLDANQRRRLADRFAEITGKGVDVRVQVDPAVIGSMSVRIGDEVYDGTVRRQLELARERLGA